MLLNILLVILVIDCVALTGVILLQRSEGGALGMGGGPSGMFTARGAGDLLTRTTGILTIVFFSLSLIITLLAGHSRSNASVTERLKVNHIDLDALAKQGKAAPAPSSAPAPPLPNAAPPLPTSLPPQGAAQGTGQPPRPSAAPRPSNAAISLPKVALPQTSGAVRLPRPDITAPAEPASPAKPPPPGQ